MRGFAVAATCGIACTVVPASPASAASADTLKGGCGFAVEQDPVNSPGVNQGVMYELSTSHNSAGQPSYAFIECFIEINGTLKGSTYLASGGTGAQYQYDNIFYSVADGDAVSLCQRVYFADGTVWTAADGNVGTDCQPIA